MYTLYYAPGAASLAVHWMLLELDVEHRLVLVDLAGGEHKRPEYLHLNPAGVVPTLVVDGVPRAECAALLTLLAERHPHGQLAPAPASAERAAYLQWMFFLANTVQPQFRRWFYPGEPAGEAHREAAQARAKADIEGSFERIAGHLGGGSGSYLVGERLSGVDLLATMLMRWSRNMPRPATQWPALRRYVDGMRARPALRRVHELEGLTDWI